MNNNDIIRRLRFTFSFDDQKMIKIFGLAERDTSRAEVSAWLKKEDAEGYEILYDKDFSYFLDGLIYEFRGKKEGPLSKPEKRLNNNIIFRKLKIALSLKDEDILEILMLVDFRMGKHELSAFFRNPAQSQFRKCKDQVLRNFVHGLQVKYYVDNSSKV